ncbi:MAG: hypothetical protein U9Q95_01340 [Candidatus Eisenbacteria bacterium]|nr:hypothetical protein [Candidatus Eisenbacteria bacterium]
MMRAFVSVLLVLAAATIAGAGIPDADASYVTLDNGGKGLTTCPAGDGSPYGYITVTALRTDLTPIQGIPSGSFFFTIGGTGSGNVSISAFDAETNASGQIRFEANGTGTVPYGSLTVDVQIYTVVLTDTDLLWCNTYDYENNGVVDPIDFIAFASDFGGVNERSDFDWNGVVDPIDFISFANHFGH